MQQDTFFGPAIIEALADGTNVDLIAGLESLMAPDLRLRRDGLETLIAIDAHRRSPLAAAVIAGKLQEPDLNLRTAIVETLVDLFSPTSEMEKPSSKVITWARSVLSTMRTREIYALLQLIVHNANQLQSVGLLLQCCSFSGETMLAIVKDRRAGIEIRVAAVKAIAAIGYLDAKVELERFLQRVAGQIAGQIPMVFADRMEAEGERLIPALQEALRYLAEVED